MDVLYIAENGNSGLGVGIDPEQAPEPGARPPAEVVEAAVTYFGDGTMDQTSAVATSGSSPSKGSQPGIRDRRCEAHRGGSRVLGGRILSACHRAVNGQSAACCGVAKDLVNDTRERCGGVDHRAVPRYVLLHSV